MDILILFWFVSIVLAACLISLFTPIPCLLGLHYWKRERTTAAEDDGVVYSHWEHCLLCHTVRLEAEVELRHRKPRIVVGGRNVPSKADRRSTGLAGGKNRHSNRGEG